MKQIVKGSSVLTAVSIGEMLTRFIRTKFIALILGPTGTGFLAQLTILFEALRILGDLGSRRAVIKQVAEERFSGVASPGYRQVLKTSFLLVTVASVLTGIGVAVFSPELSQFLFGTSEHYPFIILLGFLLPFSSLSTVTSSIVKGNLDYVSYAKYTLAAYGIVMIVTPALVYYFRAWGGAIGIGLFFIFPFLSYLILNLRRKFLYFSKAISWKAFREQMTQGVLQIYQDALSHVIRIAVATLIVRELGLSQMGIFQVVLTFATVYMAVPIQAMSGYVFPLIAASKEMYQINQAINDSLRFLMFVLIPIIVAVMIMPELLIYLFFSRDFLPAVPVLQLQLFSTLFTLLCYSFAAALVAKGKIKSTFYISSIYTASFFILVWFWFPHWQLMGITLAYNVASLINACLHYAYVRHYFGTRLYPKNIRLIAMTIVWMSLAFVGVSYFDSVQIRIVLMAFGLIWFLVSSKDHERRFLIEKIGKYLRRGNLVQRQI